MIARAALPTVVSTVLLGLYAALVLALGRAVDRTADETTYLGAGRVIAVEGWVHPATRLHGPLPFYANQLFLGAEHLPEDLGRTHAEDHGELYRRGRLGMLGFGIVTALLVWEWARRLWGAWGAAASLALFVAHPLMPAHGALIAVDMAYCAGVVGSLFAAWTYVREPRHARAVFVGMAAGLSVATKFLALLTVPFVLLAVPLAAYRTRRSLGRALMAAFIAGSAAWGTLWMSYGSRVDAASTDAGSYASSVGSVADLPGVGATLALLPEPWVRGIDFQLAVGGGERNTYLRGEYAPGHLDYYFWVFVRKTPEWMLLVLVVSAVLGLSRLKRGRPRAAVAAALLVIVPAGAALLLYLSAFTALQLGVRYVLPLVPLAAILLGGVGPWLAGAGLRIALPAVGLAALATVLDVHGQWPNLLAYTNRSSGGPDEGWRAFRDSNTDWGQMRRRGRAELEMREGLEILAPAGGPRLGPVAAYFRDLTVPDPEDPTRSRHWLDAFDVVGHAGPAWCVFDVDAADWETLAEKDGRRRSELATALLAAGLRSEAERVAGALTGTRREAWEAFLTGVEASSSQVAARAWLGVGRGDLALARLEGEDPSHPEVAYTRARALALEGLEELAEEALALASDESPPTLVFHVQLLRRLGRPEEALTWLEARLPAFDELVRAGLEELRSGIAQEVADRAILRGVLEAGG